MLLAWTMHPAHAFALGLTILVAGHYSMPAAIFLSPPCHAYAPNAPRRAGCLRLLPKKVPCKHSRSALEQRRSLGFSLAPKERILLCPNSMFAVPDHKLSSKLCHFLVGKLLVMNFTSLMIKQAAVTYLP